MIVKTGASRSEVTERDGVLTVLTSARPVAGQANAAVIKLLAEYLDVAPSLIRIARGSTARTKCVEIYG